MCLRNEPRMLVLNVLENFFKDKPSYVKTTFTVMPRASRPSGEVFPKRVDRHGLHGIRLEVSKPGSQQGPPTHVRRLGRGSSLEVGVGWRYDMCSKPPLGLDYHAVASIIYSSCISCFSFKLRYL
jgi:hypothetical protein